ncbi:hypothetical protein KCG44_14250 [Pacificimonas sp. WHA3]|uniref:Uncharacterized protein n=1 Tax=Pacificimonas pallii TaxID=2827236 RepID=A0ABS6SHP9_9SPHN|nr:hypothetical protein [Pacificimonas pallii]MBV7257944.1 hypothetical protein [Pacificimonas pallii]
MSLHDAIEAVRKIEEKYRSSAVDRTDGARLIGYSTLSGPANKALASLAQYGLVERAGKGHMRVTPRAAAILHPESEIERRDQIRKAGLEPRLFQELEERFPGIVPPEEGVETHLSRQGFNQSAIRPAMKAYLDTLLFLEQSGAIESHGAEELNSPKPEMPTGSGNNITYGGARVGDLIDYESEGSLANPEPMRVRAVMQDKGKTWVFVDGSEAGLEMDNVIVRERPDANSPPKMPLAEKIVATPEGYRSETFDADEGTIKIEWPSNLSEQSVEDMNDWLELLKKRISRRAMN